MSLRYNYNSQVSPPAPFVYVTISLPHDAGVAISDIPAQVDTGADMSAIPASLADRLHLVQLDQMPIASFGGRIAMAPTYLVGVAVQPFAAILVRVIANEEEPFVLLGRDVLNRYEIVLDGPNLLFEIRSS